MPIVYGSAGIALAAALVAFLVAATPAKATPTLGQDSAHPVVAASSRLALNPQPEPPGRRGKKKIKKGGDPAKPK